MLSRIITPFLEQYHRWILWCPVFVACGVGVYFSLPSEPDLVLPVFFLTVASALLILFRGVFSVRIALIVIICVGAGLVAGIVRTEYAGTALLKTETSVVEIEGTVRSIEHEKSSSRILLHNVLIEDIARSDTPKYVRIKLAQKFGSPQVGERIKLLGVLRPPSPPVAPRSYDFQRHMFFQGIGATGYAIKPYEVVSTSSVSKLNSETLRETIKARIQKADGSDNAKAVLTALLTGERELISDDLWEDIRKSGIAHLLAISGLHIGLVAGFVFFIFRAVLALIPYTAVYWPVRKISAIAAFLAILSFCWLVGAPISAERAVIMTGIVLFAILIDRVAISLRTASFAAVIILLVMPEMLLTPGFQMSFAAVICLIAFYESASDKMTYGLYGRGVFYKGSAYFLATLVTTVVASLATAPFALYNFQRVSLLPGILANMVAVPMTALLVMPVGLIGLILMPFHSEALALSLAMWGIDIVLNVAGQAASMKYSILTLSSWPPLALILIVIGGLWLTFWKGNIRWFGILGAACAVFVVLDYKHPNILISAEGKLIGIYEDSGNLALSNSRTERFTRNVWQSEQGQPEAVYWPKEGQILDGRLSCDYQGCLYSVGGLKISFPHFQMATYQDCVQSDLVVMPMFYEYPEICQDTYIISRTDIKRNGSHAVYLHDTGFTVETVRDIRGVRPWTIYEK